MFKYCSIFKIFRRILKRDSRAFLFKEKVHEQEIYQRIKLVLWLICLTMLKKIHTV